MELFRQFMIMALSYFLFYYSTPYWSSAQIKDVINHGLYQSLFITLSSAGNLLYKGVERVNELADEKLNLAPGGAVHGAANAVVYTVIIWLATCLYNGAGNQVLQGGGTYTLSFSEWSNVSNVSVFWGSLRMRMQETPGFFSGATAAGISMLLYVGVTILYSAFMYGLLRYIVITVENKQRIR